MKPSTSLVLLSLLLNMAGSAALSQSIPTPESVLGNKPGADFFLATYDEALNYMKRLDAATDKMQLVRVGETSGGLEWHMALISAPANLAALDRYKEIAGRLARAEGLSDDEARRLASEGRAMVHIDSGLHATEVAHAQHAIQLAYDLVATEGDPQIDRILDDVILTLWFSINPDGQNMVANWYRRNLGTPYEVSPLPWLYQKYVGHDNNRDGYMNNMHESQVVTRTILEYNPQVIYNHHQSSPFPTRIWIPPFAEPISSNVHPLMWRWVNLFGTSMAAYLEDRQMPGAIHRGRGFDDWYPGFIDHVNSFRNTISFLTETALYRYATPHFYTLNDFPSNRRDLRAEVLYASPWKGGWWRLGDAVRYMLGASMSVLDTASKYRERIQFNRYQAGRDTVARFTNAPPYAYVIPTRQRDLHRAGELVEKLLINGIRVHQAEDTITIDDRRYPAGSWVVLMDQAYARLVKELFEVQNYPDLRDFPDGPPDQPYDVAGWTLPLQMGVEVTTVSRPVGDDARSQLMLVNSVDLPAGSVDTSGAGIALPVEANVSARALNRLLGAGGSAVLAADGSSLVVTGADADVVRSTASDLALQLKAATAASDGIPIKRPRIGLYRPWRASIDEGWTRWLLENYEFDFTSLYNREVRAGRLGDSYDVILIADMRAQTVLNGYPAGTIPAEFAGGVGRGGMDNLREFVSSGGTLITFNASSRMVVSEFNLDIEDKASKLGRKEFFGSGSLLKARLEGSPHPLTAGIASDLAVSFHRGPAFEPKAGFKGRVLARYEKNQNPLLSGYLLGPEHIQGRAALIEAEYGDGRIVLFGFKPQWRGQTHGTYRFLFNALFYFGDTVAEAEDDEETEEAQNFESQSWQRLRRSIHSDLEKLVAGTRTLSRSRGSQAVAASRALDGLVGEFQKNRLSALDELRSALPDSSAAGRPLRSYAASLRNALVDLAAKDLSSIDYSVKDLSAQYGLGDLEDEIKEALRGR